MNDSSLFGVLMVMCWNCKIRSKYEKIFALQSPFLIRHLHQTGHFLLECMLLLLHASRGQQQLVSRYFLAAALWSAQSLRDHMDDRFNNQSCFCHESDHEVWFLQYTSLFKCASLLFSQLRFGDFAISAASWSPQCFPVRCTVIM